MTTRRAFLAQGPLVLVAGCNGTDSRTNGSTDPETRTERDEGSDRTLVDVQEYGAVGDGETDDTAAIRSALADATPGDTVYFPASSEAYLVSQDDPTTNGVIFQIDASFPTDVMIAGEGPGSTIRVDGGHEGPTYLWRLDANGPITGLEFHHLRFDGDRTAQTIEQFGALLAVIERDAALSPGDIDVRIRNLEALNSWYTGINLATGGVSIERCTVANSEKHNIGISSGGGLERPPVKIRSSLITDNQDSRFYGIDCSDGRWLVEDTVIDGCSQGTKISTGYSEGTYRRVRITNSEKHSFNSTNTDAGGVTLEDCVIGPGNGQNFNAAHVPYEIAAGSDLVITGNDDAEDRAALLFRSDAEIDASDATIWSNNNRHSGLECNSQISGNVIDTYFHADNGEGPLGSTSNLTINEMAEREKTDIEAVPTADEVGAWSQVHTDHVPLW